MKRATVAVVIQAPGEVGLREVCLGSPGPDDVVIETAYTSISAGTERMLLAGQMPHPMLQLPVIPGYETVGRVTATGANVSDEWLDRWVYVGGAHCYDGINPAWGGQSAKLFTSVERVVPLEGVPPKQGVLLALTATALHGIDLVDPQVGDRLLILGQGPVGQLAARIARQRGSWTAVVDRNPARLGKSEADLSIDVSRQALADHITEPVETIIDATGSMEAIAAALPHLAQGGKILLLGYYQQLTLPYMPLFLKEAQLITAKEWATGDLQRSRDLIATGEIDVTPLMTHERQINDVSAAYHQALNDLDCLKMVIHWGDNPKA